ncbi:MAG TPA: ThiF family adenylyltransferase [Steroidobacteraceae bacterium]|nr:ThiF family adenylyltransferase [Steroidobacteraceae bacterium]
MDRIGTARYQRHELIDWFSQQRLADSRVAVIGAGAVGNEVLKNLVLLGTGAVDVFDFDLVEVHNLTRSIFLREQDVGSNKAVCVVQRAGEVDPNVSLRAFPGHFRDNLSLAMLQRYDCVISAVDNFEARIQLSQMCRLAAVDLVNAAIDSRWITVERFAFGSGDGSACYECNLPESAYQRVAARYSCGGLRRLAQAERRVPTTAITASIAGALAVSTALRLGDATDSRARRIFVDSVGGASRVTLLERRAGCPGCGASASPPQVVRTRNRWLSTHLFGDIGPSTQQHLVRLSDALITGYTCRSCGPVPGAERYLRRRATDFDESIAVCTQCGENAVVIEVRDVFRLGELGEMFGRDAVPAKYAIVEIGERSFCFDLEEDTDP